MAAQPTTTPFDHRLSTRLDLIQIQLDERPAAPRRWYLKARKRLAERHLPLVLQAVATVGAAIDLCANCQDELGYPDIDSFALCETCRDRGVR